MASADVIVVGAGVMGCSVAYYLARRSIRVLAIDRGSIGGEASSACDGYVVSQTKSPGAYLALALQSADMLRSLHVELDADVGYRQTGSLIVMRTESECDFMEAHTKALRLQGVSAALLSRDEVREEEPVLSGRLLGASLCPDDGTVDPLALTRALYVNATRLGARFLQGTSVTRVTARHGVWAVETSGGTYEAAAVVLAAGIGLPALMPGEGPRLSMNPLFGQLLVTERLPKVLRHCILDARYIALKHRRAGGGEDHDDPLGAGFGLEQTMHGNVLIGNTREAGKGDRTTSIRGVRAIARQAAEIAPFLRAVHIIRSFGGLRPYTADGMPLVGPVEGQPGLFLCGGHGSDGITLSPMSGKLLAEMLVSGETPAACSWFLPSRLSADARGSDGDPLRQGRKDEAINGLA